MTPFTTTIDLLLNDGELVQVECDCKLIFAKEEQEQDEVIVVQALVVKGTLLHPTGEDLTNYINDNEDVHFLVEGEVLTAYEDAEDAAFDADGLDHERDLADLENEFENRDHPL